VAEKNKFVPDGTMENGREFSASFQDAMICGRESSHNVTG
jgi:hypothetical protein